MLKKLVKSIVIIMIIFVMIMSGNIMIALATTQSDLDAIQGKIDDTKNRIEDVDAKLSSTMEQIRKLNADIAEYENSIADLDTKIDDVNAQIAETEENLKKAEEEYQNQDALLKKRLVAMYEAGETTYLDVLLSSTSVSDFISRYYIVTEIAEGDRNLLDKMEKNKASIEEAKSLLETSKEQIEILRKNKVDTANSLKNSKSAKQSYIDQLTEEEKSLNDDLEQFEQDKKKIQAELERIARENNGGKDVVAGDPSSAGYIFPVEGLNIYNINRRYYPSYPGHTGVDININVRNKRVIAAKAGTVVISAAQRRADGSYRSYGEYVVIDHHDGTMTLYGHMSPDSRAVSKGDEVVQGQVLGIVGTTGNSTGLHLHFEVRVNGRCVNPLPYLQ